MLVLKIIAQFHQNNVICNVLLYVKNLRVAEVFYAVKFFSLLEFGYDVWCLSCANKQLKRVRS